MGAKGWTKGWGKRKGAMEEGRRRKEEEGKWRKEEEGGGRRRTCIS